MGLYLSYIWEFDVFFEKRREKILDINKKSIFERIIIYFQYFVLFSSTREKIQNNKNVVR